MANVLACLVCVGHASQGEDSSPWSERSLGAELRTSSGSLYTGKLAAFRALAMFLVKLHATTAPHAFLAAQFPAIHSSIPRSTLRVSDAQKDIVPRGLVMSTDDEPSSEGKETPGEDLEALTVKDLKEKLRSLGLKVTGNKAELIARLEEHARTETVSAAAEAPVAVPPAPVVPEGDGVPSPAPVVPEGDGVPSSNDTQDVDTTELRRIVASLRSEINEKDSMIAQKDNIIKSMMSNGSKATSSKVATVDIMSFVKELSEQPATEVRDGVDFMRYNDKYVNPPMMTNPEDREVLLYLPGLDFAGVTGCSSFPALASRYEIWRCRVESSDRSIYADLAHAVVGFVEDQNARGKSVTLMGESFGGLLAVGVAQRLVKNNIVGGASKSRLAGVILVNPATSYDRAPISVLGPALTKLPAEKIDVPFLPDAEVVRGSVAEKVRPRVSLYSISAGALLAASVPDVPQILRGIRGIVNDVLSASSSPDSPRGSAGMGELANRATSALVGLDSLASRLSPSTLSWRLQNWLARGSSEVNLGLAKLKDKGVPFLVLAGDQDRLLPSRIEAERLERILGPRTCQSVVLKDTGHAAFDERLDILKLIDNSPMWN